MNFLDTYDIDAVAAPASNQPEQSLSEEVSQVVGQLGRFWGGFRKQSQTALQAARKDLGDVVVQAQKELTKLTTTSESAATEPAPESEAGTSTDTETTPSASTSTLREAPTAPTSTQNLFSRLQSALPPNVVATVSNHLPESLKHASENIDLAQLRTNLLGEFQRVQGVTRAQAEEYVHKSEALLREAVKEAGEALREAVKVVPPEQAEGSTAAGSSSGLVWDGTDMWMLPSEPSESSSGKETQRAVATRAETLLRRLKADPTFIRHDPEADAGVKDQYMKWLEEEVNSKDGGIEGDIWTAKISSALLDPTDGQSLKSLHETLVPSEMIDSVFWSRFFFRTHQIRQEEEKRKALIQRTVEEDDFSWEDDEEEAPSGAVKTSPSGETITSLTDAALKQKLPVPSSDSKAPSATPSTRVSSEDSFDVVSSNVSVAGDEKAVPEKAKDDSDGDSDWE